MRIRIPTVSLLPNSKCPHSLPYSLVTPLPGSHDELVPGGIKSKLGEIPDSRVSEVRDPRLQIWQRQGETLLLLLDRVSKFSGIIPGKITPAEVEYRAEAPQETWVLPAHLCEGPVF